jgi:fibronectin type III domain protein
MNAMHRSRTGARPQRRILRAAILTAIVTVVSVPSAAFALFSATPAATSAGVSAATISSPTGFSATGASSTTAVLSWTAPATLTGYKLTQSPGTLAGCPATPTAGTTSCTATGLSPNTTYTYALTAVYNSWAGPSVQATVTTSGSIRATLLASATDTSSSQSTTVTGVNTTSGAPLLILVYRQVSNGSQTPTPTWVTGSAISAASQIAAEGFSPSSKCGVAAWRATGTGTSGGTVTVSFGSNGNVTTTIDVVQLSGASPSSPVSQSTVTTSSGQTATGGSLPGVSPGNGEVFFVGLATSTTLSTPSGYAAIDAPASGVLGSWYSSSASSGGISTSLGTSTYWATIEVAIQS